MRASYSVGETGITVTLSSSHRLAGTPERLQKAFADMQLPAGCRLGSIERKTPHSIEVQVERAGPADLEAVRATFDAYCGECAETEQAISSGAHRRNMPRRH